MKTIQKIHNGSKWSILSINNLAWRADSWCCFGQRLRLVPNWWSWSKPWRFRSHSRHFRSSSGWHRSRHSIRLCSTRDRFFAFLGACTTRMNSRGKLRSIHRRRCRSSSSTSNHNIDIDTWVWLLMINITKVVNLYRLSINQNDLRGNFYIL